jgi:hypothetical protein
MYLFSIQIMISNIYNKFNLKLVVNVSVISGVNTLKGI